MNKLEVILKKVSNYCNEDFPDESVMSVKDAKQAILKLIRMRVKPSKQKGTDNDGRSDEYVWDQGWNCCVDQMLDNLKKLEG